MSIFGKYFFFHHLNRQIVLAIPALNWWTITNSTEEKDKYIWENKTKYNIQLNVQMTFGRP